MNILLVSRDNPSDLSNMLSKDENLWICASINDLQEGMIYWRCYQQYIDTVLVLEQETNLFEKDFQEENLNTLSKIAKNKDGRKVIYITTNKNNFEIISKQNINNIHSFLVADKDVFLEMTKTILYKNLISQDVNNVDNAKIFNEINKILKNEAKALAFTGQCGAGITASAVHIAYHASILGIKTYIINMGFSEDVYNTYFQIAAKNQVYKHNCDSFVNSILNPDSFEKFSYKVNDNLYLATYFDATCLDNDRLMKVFEQKALENAVSAYKKKAQLIIFDVPLNEHGIISGLTFPIDLFALCVSNNLYSLNYLTKLLKSARHEAEFYEKSKLVLSKFHMRNTYGGKAFNGELACKILEQMNKEMDIKFRPGGIILAVENFMTNIEGLDNPSINNIELKKKYLETLLQLITT